MSRPSVYEHYPWLGWRLSQATKRTVRCAQLAQAKLLRPDCIYLERGCLNDDSLDLDLRFRKCTRRLVLDVDDGIFLERPEKIDRLLQISDHVVVSTDTILEYVRPKHPHITLIPTAVSMQRYQARPAAGENALPVIGWIGTAPNMAFLRVCAEALRQLASKYDFELFVVGPTEEPLRKIDLQGVNVCFQPWSADAEIDHLHRMDIGLMPLPEGQEWMKYKAATKLVQYLAIGIPAVASPIGVNAGILDGSRVGYAARNTDEWVDALEKLLLDRELRTRLGQAGRELVAARYSIEANQEVLERVLRGA